MGITLTEKSRTMLAVTASYWQIETGISLVKVKKLKVCPTIVTEKSECVELLNSMSWIPDWYI